MQQNPIISFKGVNKSFGAVQVLKGVDLDIAAGNVVAMIGRSGSGKSTALRCVNGLERIDSGELTVCGRDLHGNGHDLRALRQEVGIVFQSYNLFPHLSVAENVMLAPRKVKRVSRSEARQIAEDVLHKVGLSEKFDSYPAQLSGGQQQRVAIARSLAMQPSVLLLDEVTSALDPELTGEVLKVIGDLAESGMTMLIVTHEMAFARSVAKEIIFMHQGKMWERGGREMLAHPNTPELKNFVSSGL